MTIESKVAMGHSARDATELAPLPKVTGHIPALDGLRGIAILAVMFCHFVPYSDHPSSVIGKVFFFVSRMGFTGVDLFFVLSGFLITGILYQAKGSEHFFRNFYARRTVRIFPLYYAVLTAIFVVIPLINPHAFATEGLTEIRYRQAWLWTYGTNLIEHGEEFLFHSDWLDLNPFWSLAVEEHFYLVWPLIVFLFARGPLLWISTGLIITAMAVRTALELHGGHDTGIYVMTPCRMDALACGALLALAMRCAPSIVRQLLHFMPWVLIFSGVVAGYFLLKDPSHARLLSAGLGHTSVAIFFGAFLVQGVASRKGSFFNRAITLAPLRFLGKYSYGLYVYHVILHSTFDKYFGQPLIMDLLIRNLHLGHAAYGISVILFIPLAIAASIGIALISWQLFESPFLKLKKYFEYAPRKQSPQTLATSQPQG